jgi:putative salt-induced outer membrane protein
MFDVRGSGLRWAALCLPLTFSARAFAQDPAPPKGLLQQAPASGGSTEVATEGFQTAAARAAAEAESKDATTLKLTAGGFLSQGNSRSIAATGAVDYFMRRSSSALSVLAAANYGRSVPADGDAYETTVNNYQARLRYDYFFATSVAAFFNISGRRDEFQGLDLRLNMSPGLAYYFIDEKGERLWGELGYDFQYDIRSDDFRDEAALDGLAQTPPVVVEIDKSEVRHNARLFAGYDNQLSDSVKFGTGLEYLQNVTAATNARVNFDAALTSQLYQDFSIATTVSVKYDNNPLPGVEKTDFIMALNLVYTID